jgi:hypothetical protein
MEGDIETYFRFSKYKVGNCGELLHYTVRSTDFLITALNISVFKISRDNSFPAEKAYIKSNYSNLYYVELLGRCRTRVYKLAASGRRLFLLSTSLWAP